MIRIRIPTEVDSPALIELVREFPTPTPSSAAELAEIFVRKLNDSTAYIFVAEDEDGLVGYVSGCRRTAFYAGGDTAWVDEILVSPSRRGRNIGGMLMQEFEQRAATDGCKLVSLATAGAGPFYSKRGYETKAGYYKKYLGGAEQDNASEGGTDENDLTGVAPNRAGSLPENTTRIAAS
jgi:predicted N-acetyltransferase YhbS